jgi:hypothetical protein
MSSFFKTTVLLGIDTIILSALKIIVYGFYNFEVSCSDSSYNVEDEVTVPVTIKSQLKLAFRIVPCMELSPAITEYRRKLAEFDHRNAILNFNALNSKLK